MSRLSVIVVFLIGSVVPVFAQTAQPCTPGVALSPAVFSAGGAVDGPIDGVRACTAAAKEITCGRNGTYLFTFTVTNNTGGPVTSVLLTPPAGAGYSISPQSALPPGTVLANGQSITLQVTITGGQPGQKICFPVTLLSRERGCCTIQLCVDLPNCCAAINTVRVQCNPDGTYSYTFTVTNRTSNTVQHIYLHAPAGTTITPSYFGPLNLAPGATSAPLTVTIGGAKPGRYCFGISLHTEDMKSCCTFDFCLELPQCDDGSSCANGICCSRAPMYDGTKFIGQKVAAVTGSNDLVDPSQNFVLTLFDISGANGWGVHGAPPPAGNKPLFYNGPAGSEWSAKNLGSVFGVEIDHLGNIYVTATSVYPVDSVGPAGPGGIYKIHTGDGHISTFASLPNVASVGASAPALGNIAFDCRRKQFFVTNLSDGRIYRLNMAGGVDSTFDPTTHVLTSGGAPEAGDAPGVVPPGELLWGIAVHDRRVYFSKNSESCALQNANPAIKNEIWSIGLAANGDFDPGDLRLELQVPDLPGSTFSNPITDIAFSKDGSMAIAERSLRDFDTSDAHSSRVLEFTCTRDGWKLAAPFTGAPYKYNVGDALSGCAPNSKPSNAAGGIDYDFDSGATYGLYATGDALQFFGNPVIYGFMGFNSTTGGTSATGPLIVLYSYGSDFKRHIGDIEVSCPPGENPY